MLFFVLIHPMLWITRAIFTDNRCIAFVAELMVKILCPYITQQRHRNCHTSGLAHCFKMLCPFSPVYGIAIGQSWLPLIKLSDCDTSARKLLASLLIFLPCSRTSLPTKISNWFILWVVLDVQLKDHAKQLCKHCSTTESWLCLTLSDTFNLLLSCILQPLLHYAFDEFSCPIHCKRQHVRFRICWIS